MGRKDTREVEKVRVNCVWNPENKKHKCVKLRWNFDSYKVSQLVLKGGGEKKKIMETALNLNIQLGN